MYDVIIIGAGSAGNYAAFELASLGYEVIVFDKKREVGEGICCTGIVGRECLDALPLSQDIILKKANSAGFFAPSGESLRLWKETIQAYVIDRPAFDSSLAEKAREKGAHYLLASQVRDVVVKEGHVQVEVEGQGERTIFKGKTLVIASGFGSGLPQKLGLGEIADFVMGAQTEVGIKGIEETEVYFGQEIAPGFFAWLVPTSEAKALVGVLSRRNPGLYLRNFLSSLLVQGKIASFEANITYGAIPLKPLPKTYRERVVVVGDAAGQAKPTTGGGIYYGLLSAQIAANVLHQALSSHDFSPQQFAQYEKEWKKRLSRELWIGYYARKFYEKLNDQQIEGIFHLVKSNGIPEALLKEDLSFDWHADLILKAFKHQTVRGIIPMLKHLLFPSLIHS